MCIFPQFVSIDYFTTGAEMTDLPRIWHIIIVYQSKNEKWHILLVAICSYAFCLVGPCIDVSWRPQTGSEWSSGKSRFVHPHIPQHTVQRWRFQSCFKTNNYSGDNYWINFELFLAVEQLLQYSRAASSHLCFSFTNSHVFSRTILVKHC